MRSDETETSYQKLRNDRQVFQSDGLNQLARKSYSSQRARKLDPFLLAGSMISALGNGKVESLADLGRSYHFKAK